MKSLPAFVLVSLVPLAGACSQEPAPARPEPAPAAQDPAAAGQQLVEAVHKQFAEQGIAVDAKAQTVTIKAVMNEPPDPIEYLLIHRRGKRHEAMFVTESKPSVLNAALLMIGLQPGKNATYREKDPPPTLAEIEQGVDPLIIVPPEGNQYWMTVRWKDSAGKPVEHCVEDLILDLSTGAPIGATSWVYLGGRMARIYKDEPEVFVADFEGNLISVCYLSPDNHLGTMRHERARDDQNWWITDKSPPPGTELEVVFHRREPALAQERSKRLQAAAKDAAKEPAKEQGR
jgi:hypothetical protein